MNTPSQGQITTVKVSGELVRLNTTQMSSEMVIFYFTVCRDNRNMFVK